ncbi:MAG TPA: response regulator [Polyangiaceae bacterium]|nr:response regulator [Polyangiaceae bacterium]
MNRGETILVVDDDAKMQAILHHAAELSGMSTVSVVDAKRAIEEAAERRPDMILLEIGAGGGAGRLALNGLKNDERTKAIPVFVVSARTSREDRMDAFELGADDYFDKSFDVTLLFRRIAHTLEKARSGNYSVSSSKIKINVG